MVSGTIIAAVGLTFVRISKPAPIVWATPDNATVTMSGFDFLPPNLAVAADTNVTWINRYPIAHRVTTNSTSPNFSSPSLATGGTFTFTFSETGEYPYYCGCGLHPDMKGKIIVLPKK